MPKPVTPLVGCDVFVQDQEGRVLLVKRADNGLWCIPGGCQDLGETPQECAIREFKEETGFDVKLEKLLGVFSSSRYEYVHYLWKDNEFTHILFLGTIVGGEKTTSAETSEIAWFSKDELPSLSDGHQPRIDFTFNYLENGEIESYFE